jgi:hypothetical protein
MGNREQATLFFFAPLAPWREKNALSFSLLRSHLKEKEQFRGQAAALQGNLERLGQRE